MARPASRRPAGIRVLRLAAVLAGVIVGLAITAGGVWLLIVYFRFEAVASRLPRTLRLAREQGLPFTPADLAPKTRLPASENAAPLYEEIMRRLQGAPRADSAFEEALQTGRSRRYTRSAAQAALMPSARVIGLAERAAALPGCDFRRDWSQGYDLLFREYAALREVARILAAKAWLENDSGHPRAALRTVAVIARIGQHTGSDPILIAMLVRIAIQAIADAAWYRIVKANGNRPDLLEAASEADAAFGPLPDLRYVMRGEMVMSQVTLDRLRSGRVSSAEGSVRPGLFGRLALDAFEERNLEFWIRAFAVLDNMRLRSRMQTYWELKRVIDGERRMAARDPYTGILTAMLVPVYAKAQLQVVHCAAMRRLRRATIDVLRYRNRTGRFPADLRAACATGPAPARRTADCIDPFTGTLLRYGRTARGFLLYSVGENLRDDGGQIKRRAGHAPLDLGISYP